MFSAAIGGTERTRNQPTIEELEAHPLASLALSLRALIDYIQSGEGESTGPRAPHRKCGGDAKRAP